MKKVTYLFAGVVIFVLSIFGTQKIIPDSEVKVWLTITLTMALLFLWAWYGAKLKAPLDKKKQQEQANLLVRQAQWSGQTLIVPQRWFKSIFLCIVLISLCALVAMWLISLFHHPERTAKGVVGFCLLVLCATILLLTTWAWVGTSIAALFQRFALTADARGLHLAGLSIMPWHGVTRVAHRLHENRGVVYHYLVLEFQPDVLTATWPSAFRLLLSGYVTLAMMRLFSTHLARLSAGHLDAPVPMIVTAIQKISAVHSAHQVATYEEFATLEESREMAQLFKQASEINVVPVNTESMMKRFAAGQRLSADDEKELESGFKRTSKYLDVQQQALYKYYDMRDQITNRFIAQMKKDTKAWPWIFVMLATIVLLGVSLKACK